MFQNRPMTTLALAGITMLTITAGSSTVDPNATAAHRRTPSSTAPVQTTVQDTGWSNIRLTASRLGLRVENAEPLPQWDDWHPVATTIVTP